MTIDSPTVGSNTRTAVIVGVLFLIALVPFMIGELLYGPSTGSADFLENAYPDRDAVTFGILLEFIAVLAIPLIGVFMFPVLRRFHEALALTYVAFRALEAVLLIANQVKVLSLIDLSDDHLNSAGSDTSQLQAMGDALLSEKDQVFSLYVLVFGLGALVFYGMLYYSRLVPRWLAGWGFAAAIWMMIGDLIGMFDAFSGSDSLLETIFVIPIPINEIVLAFWLIFKGFNRSEDLRGVEPALDRATVGT